MGEQTSEAVAQLRAEVRRLQAENRRLEDRVTLLEKENHLLREQLERTMQQAFRQAAPFRRQEQHRIPADQHKRPGRKAGHPGSCRAAPPVIDEDIEVPLDECPICHGPVKDCRPITQIIEELPPIRPHVTRLTTYEGRCEHCGTVRSLHPLQTSTARGCAKVQLGPRALAWTALLNKGMGLTVRTTCRVLKDLCGLRITPGGLCQALSRVADHVRVEYEALIERIRASPAVHVDETSWWVGGPGWWLWTFTTQRETVYRAEHCRGSVVVSAVLGERYAGMLVSDCLSSYDPADCAKHKCIAHHLRAISDARKLPGMTDMSYLDRWSAFFHGVLALYKMRPTLPDAEFIEKRQSMERWCDELLATPAGQSGDEAVRNRLLKQRRHLLGCLYNPAAEPTNNRAERALRPAVIGRKLSCGNKTDRGRTTWQILISMAATYRQQGLDFVHELIPKLALRPAIG